MPSATHEALVALFRDRPDLAPSLMRDALHVPLPEWSEVEVREAALTALEPTEYRADLVLLLRDGVPVFGIVLEVQLTRAAKKRYTWPVYVACLRERWGCPCCVLVVSPKRSVAAWAAEPIDLGQPGSPFRPLVLGPEGVPWVSDAAAALAAPELAILSALAHENEPGGSEVALAALRAAESLDAERGRFYYDLVLGGLNDAARIALEALMHTQGYKYTSYFAKEHFSLGKAEGKAEGKRESLLAILDARHLRATPAERELIESTTDLDLLGTWIARALSASTVAEVLAEDPA